MKPIPCTTAYSVLLLSLLAGCGGGGSGGSASTASAAQGAYEGTTSNGNSIDTVVLENDQYWGVYGKTVGSIFILQGLVQGNGQSGNGSFSSSDLRQFNFDGSVASGILNASYVPSVSFNGSASSASQTLTFTETAIPAARYDYNAAATLGDISGAWLLVELSGAPIALTVASNGTFIGASASCSFNGTLTPRPSGKNVFNLVLTYAASFSCNRAGQSFSGIAVDYILGSGKRQLILAGVDGPRNNATIVFGSR